MRPNVDKVGCNLYFVRTIDTANCIDCGKNQGLFDAWYDQRCVNCHLEWKLENDAEF